MMERHTLSTIRPAISWLLIGTLCGPCLAATQQAGMPKLPAAFSLAAAIENETAAQPQPGTPKDVASGEGIHIVVVSGNNGVNVLRKKITVRPVVQVMDGKNRPLSGVLVTFTSPASGPSVEFDGSTRTALVVTGEDGRVSPVTAIAVNAGPFVYHVRALYQEQEADETIAQTNVQNGSGTADPAPSSTRTTTGAVRDHRFPGWAYAALIGGAAAGIGIGIALGSRQSAKAATTSSTATIGAPGSATVGAP